MIIDCYPKKNMIIHNYSLLFIVLHDSIHFDSPILRVPPRLTFPLITEAPGTLSTISGRTMAHQAKPAVGMDSWHRKLDHSWDFMDLYIMNLWLIDVKNWCEYVIPFMDFIGLDPHVLCNLKWEEMQSGPKSTRDETLWTCCAVLMTLPLAGWWM